MNQKNCPGAGCMSSLLTQFHKTWGWRAFFKPNAFKYHATFCACPSTYVIETDVKVQALLESPKGQVSLKHPLDATTIRNDFLGWMWQKEKRPGPSHWYAATRIQKLCTCFLCFGSFWPPLATLPTFGCNLHQAQGPTEQLPQLLSCPKSQHLMGSFCCLHSSSFSNLSNPHCR